MSVYANEQNWFPEQPEWTSLLEWEKIPPELGPLPAEKYVELSVRPILSNHIDVERDASAMLLGEPPKAYGVVLENMCCLLSRDAERCKPVEMRVTLTTELSERNITPAISGAWPKPGTPPPVYVKRIVKRGFNGKLTLGVEYAGAKAGAEVGPESSRTLEEMFERYEPENIPFIGDGRVTWCIRSTNTHPTIEGIHYSGIWVTHDSSSYVRIRVGIEVWAKVRRAGIWRRYKLEPVELPEDSTYWEFALYRQE